MDFATACQPFPSASAASTETVQSLGTSPNLLSQEPRTIINSNEDFAPVMPIDPQVRTKLERHWKERLINAQQEFESAKAHLQSIGGDPYGLNAPDGAYPSALRRETAALIEYARVLRIYTDLVLNGKMPDDDDQAKAVAAE